MEENDIFIIPDKFGYLCITRYNPYTRRLFSDKYAIQISKIRSLLLFIGKQDHKTRGFRS
jgi:hypothetical protein